MLLFRNYTHFFLYFFFTVIVCTVYIIDTQKFVIKTITLVSNEKYNENIITTVIIIKISKVINCHKTNL